MTIEIFRGSDIGVRLSPWTRVSAVLLVLLVGIGIPYPCGSLTRATLHGLGINPRQVYWSYLHLAELYQLAFALLLIFAMKRWTKLDFGLRLPEGKSYVRAAIGWGVAFGVIMTLVDYGPQIARHVAPSDHYERTWSNVLGWLSFEGMTAGLSEETLYRGLLLGILTAVIPGRIRVGRFQMNLAGVALAGMFAAAHVFNFWHRPFWIAFGQQGYAFALGILYAYWRERSGSVVAAIVGHNVGDVAEGILGFLLAWCWMR